MSVKVGNFRNSSGKGIGDICTPITRKIVDSVVATMSNRVRMALDQAINDHSNWNLDGSYEETYDLDLFRASPTEHNNADDKHMSIADAINVDTSETKNSSIIRTRSTNKIYFGNIDNLLKMSARILYFEFGTFQKSEASEMGISSFSGWQNPYIKMSTLRAKRGTGGWGFARKDGIGRWGKGVMVRLSRKGAKPVSGISPVRMFRNAIPVVAQQMSSIKQSVVAEVKNELGLR